MNHFKTAFIGILIAVAYCLAAWFDSKPIESDSMVSTLYQVKKPSDKNQGRETPFCDRYFQYVND
jgi:hypothetical protein